MPIIGNVGRRSWKVRALNISLHVILILGAVTMIYPFMIMISGSFKSAVDSRNFSVWPKYFTDDAMLFRKYVEARYGEETSGLLRGYRSQFLSFDLVMPPERPVERRWTDWRSFLEQTGAHHGVYDYLLSEQSGRGIYPRNNRAFATVLKKECGGDLDALNRKYGTMLLTWDEVNSRMSTGRNILSRRFNGDYRGILARYLEFADTLPLWHRVYPSMDGTFVEIELKQAYGGDLDKLNKALGTQYPRWQDVNLDRTAPDGPMREHWLNFVQTLLHFSHISLKAEAAATHRGFLKERHASIEALNSVYRTTYTSFDDVPLAQSIPGPGDQRNDWALFVESAAQVEHLMVTSVEFDYRDWLKVKYDGDLAALNQAHEAGYAGFSQVSLPPDAPEDNRAMLADWSAFVRGHAAASSIELRSTAQQEFITFFKEKLRSDGDELCLPAFNRLAGTRYESIANVYPPAREPVAGEYRELWLCFVRDAVSPQHLSVDADAESAAWQAFLEKKFSAVDRLNSAYGLTYESFEDVPVDHWNNDWLILKENRKSIKREFVKRNYVMVMSVMLYNGRAIFNTFIYCAMAIGTALLINPIGAYAMSRFKLPTSYKILLFLMLTMAFPPMVMGIPNFLMLKRLNLLNTFWALVLPTAANGYFIFLLKGFFDSLPPELFECATLDGASEWQIFWNIAMALSKPIMAVIALSAFNLAYRNFMFAFIVCQDQRMWTMMVHIYQLMQRSCQGVGFAALVLAAIPVFLVFVFCQNIIIRGIVVPTEK